MSKPYTVTFRHKGKTRTMDFHATDDADAQAQMNSAWHNGEFHEVVYRAKGPEWLSKLIGG